MPRDTTYDGVIDTLVQRYDVILSPLTGWGVLGSGAKAVYGELGLPMPQEPFPACYIYLAGIVPDQTQGTGILRLTCTVTGRIIGGPITPGYKFDAERKVYTMINAVLSELEYRQHLQDPTNNDAPFPNIDPNGKLKLGNPGRIQGFSYGDQGTFIGIEIPTTVSLIFHLGRVS